MLIANSSPSAYGRLTKPLSRNDGLLGSYLIHHPLKVIAERLWLRLQCRMCGCLTDVHHRNMTTHRAEVNVHLHKHHASFDVILATQ